VQTPKLNVYVSAVADRMPKQIPDTHNDTWQLENRQWSRYGHYPLSHSVIPACAGIHDFIASILDPRFHGDDTASSERAVSFIHR
jgi:hypothetical protein